MSRSSERISPVTAGSPSRARRLLRAAAVAAGVVVASVVLGGPASATWSVVGTDQATGQVGAAVASCVDAQDLTTTMALVPKSGGAVSIGQAPGATPAYLAAALRSSDNPTQVVDAVRSPQVDAGFALRQYGVAMFGTQVGAATGAGLPAPSGSRTSADGSATVQGNLVASPVVLDKATVAYDSTAGPLAARLLAALTAGSKAGGDRACGGTARAAAVVVVGPKSALFVPAASASTTDASRRLLESGDLTPAQIAEQLGTQVRAAPTGPHAPAVYLSSVVPAGGDALADLDTRYANIVAAAAAHNADATAEQVIDPAYSQGLTIAALILFSLIGLVLAALIIAGLRRADRRAAEQRAAEGEENDAVRMPYRGEVAHLFDVDLTAARRRRREAERAKQEAGDRRRTSAWSGSTW